MACALFTRLKMPQVKWDDKSLSDTVLFLPVIGVFIGALEAGLLYFSDRYGLPREAVACLYLMIPILVTGGLHLDGFIDTADAQNSYGDTPERHRILKDPHIGAFGVIRLLLYMLAALAVLFTALPKRPAIPLVGFGAPFVVSRCLVAVAVFFLKPYEAAGEEGMLLALRKGMGKRHQAIAALELLAVAAGLFFVFSPAKVWAVILLEGILFFYYRHSSYKDFGGISGDLTGWYLCMAELVFGIGVVV